MQSRTQSRIFFALLGIVALLVFGWTLFWFVTMQGAKSAFAEIDQRLAQDGWKRTCTEEGWSGFPFRLDYRCKGLTLAGPEITFAVPEMKAVALVQDPAAVRIVATSPGKATSAAGETTFTFSQAQATARFDGAAAQSVDAALADLVIAGQGGPAFSTKAVRVTVRPERDRVTLSASADQPSFDGPAKLSAQQVALDGVVAPPPPGAAKLDTFLKAVAQAGSVFKIDQMAIDGGNFSLKGKGKIGLTPEGYLDGKLRVEASSPGAIVNDLESSGVIAPGNDATQALLGILGAIGSTALTVNLDKGKVTVGPFKVGKLPPVF